VGPGRQQQTDARHLRLESRDGEVLAEATLEILGREWRKVSAKLTPTRTVNDARLVLLAHEQGALCVDMVSLFPEKTFRNRPMAPRRPRAGDRRSTRSLCASRAAAWFMPASIRRYYDWKDTIGPVEQRRAQPNYAWGYHQTMGLGYFEYFQFCQDIGCETHSHR
jgi:alpha-L-arabinofuranosidase